ncbi:uncharacterized protein [Clytia hemisphaerica]|uniref:uncharacterized protein n=1 Tax=Clytia hemisphaerica TaxID=252671 RepID=UPI0034D77592
MDGKLNGQQDNQNESIIALESSSTEKVAQMDVDIMDSQTNSQNSSSISLESSSIALPSINSSVLEINELLSTPVQNTKDSTSTTPFLQKLSITSPVPTSPFLQSTPATSKHDTSQPKTPLQRRKKQVAPIDFQWVGDKKQSRRSSESAQLQVAKSNTAVVLKSLLPDSNFDIEYQNMKAKFQLNESFYSKEMKLLVAKIGVPLQVKFDESWKMLNELEKTALASSEIVNVVNEDSMSLYTKAKRELALCKKLQKTFCLEDPSKGY